jgi:transcriptional regulator with XRE-family HTH domain
MVRNQEKYEQAMQFRKRGFTLAEIAKICEISKSTASIWLKNKAFSDTVTKQNKKRAGVDNAKRLKLINKARVSERANRYNDIARAAETEFKHYKNDPRFVAGVMIALVQGETTTAGVIRVTSSRLAVHKVFIRFAVEYLGVAKEKIHLWLLLYPDLSEEVCMKKWRNVTGIPFSQFYKNQVVGTKSSKRTLHHGVGNTIIASTVLQRKLERWLELIVKELAR